MDVETLSKYAVLTRNTKLRLYQSSEILIEDDACSGKLNWEMNEITVNLGAFIKIYPTKTSISLPKCLVVQVVDLVHCVPHYENLYECPRDNLLPVDENIFPYVISIFDPVQRLRMIQNEDHCKWITSLNLNQQVVVSGDMFNMNDTQFKCIIRYIGPVHQLYKVGYCFGLQISDERSGHSPQADEIPYASNYTECEPKASIFATANQISKIPKESEKKPSSINTLMNDTLGFIKSAIAPNSSVTGSVASNTSSLKRDKKSKKNKEPSSQFYDTNVNTDSFINNNNEMERNRTVKHLNADCEEFRRPTESRERTPERRAITTNTAQTQTQPQSGILKNKHKDQTKTSEKRPEIVHIQHDEREESKVFLVPKESRDIDLSELLGHSWPQNVGNSAAILNNQKSISANTNNAMGSNSSISNKSNRNKSSNPLTHINSNNVKKTNDSISSMNKSIDNKKLQKSYDNNTTTEKSDRINTQQPLYANTHSNTIPIDASHESTDVSSAVLKFIHSASMAEVPGTDLGMGSMIEVNIPECKDHLTGVIRWIGIPPGQRNILIGVELDNDCIDKPIATTNGGYNGFPLFNCPDGRGIFVTSDQCSIDRRFAGAVGGTFGNSICESNGNKVHAFNGFYDEQQTFGHMECPIVPGFVPPMKCSTVSSLEEVCGKFKGIQGHHNSCYLDVTLFSMFAFTPVFDTVLYRPPEKEDIPQYAEVQTVLRDEIVNPLRKHTYVRADRVMKLRQLLDKLSSVSGLTSEEKDPEEFLNCLLSQILRAEPFLKLNSGHDAYYYQLFVEKDERLSFPSVQQLFEQSFYSSDIKLKEVPSCLIIQMPRFGKDFKTYSRILPSQVLDVTDIIDDSPRQCSVCGKLAEFECRDCFGALQSGIGLESTSFCSKCLKTIHMHSKRANHSHRELSVPADFIAMAENISVPRLYMELFAVVCIETSHYVTFVKAGPGPDAPWCFFNSMADRKGELNGYNIPEMIRVPELPQWLSEDGARNVNETSSNDKMLPEHAKRLFCDAYMCMYQSTDVMMYR